MGYPLFLTKFMIRSHLIGLILKRESRLGNRNLYLRHYSDPILAAPLGELREAVDLLERPAFEAIDLSLGEPHFDVIPSGSNKLPADQRGWPPLTGLAELRSAIADKLLSAHNIPVNPDGEVLVTSGATGALHTALDSFINPGDAVVLFDPCSPLYSLAARQRRARIRWLTTWMDQGRTQFHVSQLIQMLKGAKLLIVNSPANPTGGILDPEDIEQLAWWARRFKVLILNDEVYEPYQYQGEPLSIGSLSACQAQTLTIGSVSKSHALAAARVGWLAGNRNLIGPCTISASMHSPFVPTLCQQMALTALRLEKNYAQTFIKALEYRRRYAFERLQAMDLRPSWPAGGFFFWMPVWDLDWSGKDFAGALLQDQRVMVTPGDLFGPSGKGYVRISFITEDGRLREGLRRLASFLECDADSPGVRKMAA